MADPSTLASDPAPLRPNDPEESACITAAQPSEDSGTTERPATPVAPRDPRRARQLSDRDLQALLFIAMCGIATQGQLAERIFRGLSEVVVSRCVKRLRALGLIETMRWNKIGVSVIRLRTAGRDLLVERGTAENAIFLSRWPTPSGFAHRLWIVDARLALDRIGGYRVQTCWQLRRKLAGTSSPIPDLLAMSSDGKRVIAIEIDSGNENLRKFVLPRLRDLDGALVGWSPDAKAAITILTVGQRRAESLRSQLPTTTATVIVDLLPDAVGRAAVSALVKLFTGA